MSVKVEDLKDARLLLLKEYRGALATLSLSFPGFPFGSAVPYCLDTAGRPLLLISRIAQHTRNLQADGRCSLLVGERGALDVQATGRLTLVAEARQLQDGALIEAAAARYYRYFPASRNYHRAHDFDFWVLEPVRWRFIGGFGSIHWLEGVEVANPFAGEIEAAMIEHMNRDHAEAIAHFVELARLPTDEPAEMVGIDTEGFHLRIGQALYWLSFPASCNNPAMVRQALVQLAHARTWPTGGQERA